MLTLLLPLYGRVALVVVVALAGLVARLAIEDEGTETLTAHSGGYQSMTHDRIADTDGPLFGPFVDSLRWTTGLDLGYAAARFVLFRLL